MSENQADATQHDVFVRREYWEAYRAVRSLRSQAYRWQGVVDPEIMHEISIFLGDAESSIDEFFGVTDLPISGVSGHALPAQEQPPDLGTIDFYRNHLHRRVRQWLLDTIDSEERTLLPECDVSDQFPDAIIRWYRQGKLDFQARHKHIQLEEVSDESQEQLADAIDLLLFSAKSVTWEETDFLYRLMGSDFPLAVTCRQEAIQAAERAQVIRHKAPKLPMNSLQGLAYFTGKLDEIRTICREIRGFQEAVLGKAQQELASVGKRLSGTSDGSADACSSMAHENGVPPRADLLATGQDTMVQPARLEV